MNNISLLLVDGGRYKPSWWQMKDGSFLSMADVKELVNHGFKFNFNLVVS